MTLVGLLLLPFIITWMESGTSSPGDHSRENSMLGGPGQSGGSNLGMPGARASGAMSLPPNLSLGDSIGPSPDNFDSSGPGTDHMSTLALGHSSQTGQSPVYAHHGVLNMTGTVLNPIFEQQPQQPEIIEEEFPSMQKRSSHHSTGAGSGHSLTYSDEFQDLDDHNETFGTSTFGSPSLPSCQSYNTFGGPGAGSQAYSSRASAAEAFPDSNYGSNFNNNPNNSSNSNPYGNNSNSNPYGNPNSNSTNPYGNPYQNSSNPYGPNPTGGTNMQTYGGDEFDTFSDNGPYGGNPGTHAGATGSLTNNFSTQPVNFSLDPNSLLNNDANSLNHNAVVAGGAHQNPSNRGQTVGKSVEHDLHQRSSLILIISALCNNVFMGIYTVLAPYDSRCWIVCSALKGLFSFQFSIRNSFVMARLPDGYRASSMGLLATVKNLANAGGGRWCSVAFCSTVTCNLGLGKRGEFFGGAICLWCWQTAFISTRC